jgi:hypothetical protein
MAISQEALYRDLGAVDRSLSWAEAELPER